MTTELRAVWDLPRAQLVTAPTGAGIYQLMGEMVRRLVAQGEGVLVLAPCIALIEQCERSVGDAPCVTVSSILRAATLCEHGDVAVIIVNEAGLASRPPYRRHLDSILAANPDAKIIAFNAG